jgi:two-component system, OmpR family, sensor histidine kinase ChvG
VKSLTVKLLAFNVLLVFLPIGSFLYLDTYEKQLLSNLEDSMVQQGRTFSAALSGKDLETEALRLLGNLKSRMESRIRVVDHSGRLLADSAVDSPLPAPLPSSVESIRKTPEEDHKEHENYERSSTEIRESFLYRLAITPINTLRRILTPPEPALPSGEYYSGKAVLLGPEVKAALEGRYGAITRVSTGGQRSVNLYSAIPIFPENGEEVTGAVLVNQSTYKILENIYRIRMDIISIFLYSLLAALVLSFLLSLTITVPIKKLRDQAEKVLDDQGTLGEGFTPLKRRDEIGDLSHSLGILSKRLKRKINFIDSFYSDVLHELKNPLTAIRSSAEVLDQEYPGDTHRFVNTILEEGARIGRLLGDIREFTAIDTHLEEEPVTIVNSRELVQETTEQARNIHGNRCDIKTTVADADLTVQANPDRLKQVLSNVLDNAIDFAGAGGKRGLVRIAVFSEKNTSGYWVVISVEDNGPGIAEGNMEKLFQRFFSDRKSGGQEHAGLGLAISLAITEGYGGKISAENRKEGGARFTIILPQV